MKTPKQKAQQRPAETVTIAAGVVAAASLVGFRITQDQAAAVVAVLAAIPAVVTYFHAKS